MNGNNKVPLILFSVAGWILLIICVLQFNHFFEIYGVVNSQMINDLTTSLSKTPLHNLAFTKQSLKGLCFMSLAYFVAILGLTVRNYKFMPGKEHGSAEWAKRSSIKKLIDNDFQKNIILTATEGISLDCRVPGVNLNTIVFGGSGTGKTRFFLMPNMMQMGNESYVGTDPKGEIIRTLGKPLEDAGFKLRVLNLVDMEKSHSYNPFEYLKEGKDEDVMTLINTIMQSTQEKRTTGDPFWDKAEMLFLQALFFYLVYEAPKSEQNIPMVMSLIRAADIKEEQESYESDLDTLFRLLEEEKGSEHIAVVQYKHFKVAAGKTAKSIVISAAARLAPYNIPAIRDLSLKDEMELGKIGEERTALFIVISPTNTTFNFIAAMLYTQLFAELDYVANWKYDGQLPLKVRFLLDEFANIGKIPNFEKILAYARSLGLSIAPIFQSLSQLKEMYKDSWETIIDNCSSFLFLGGQGVATTEYVSKMLGKETINTKTNGKTRGRQGSTSENVNVIGRELMTPTEVREMPPDECLLFIKGLKPFKSKKFDITKHKNYSKTWAADKKNAYVFKRQETDNDKVSDIFDNEDNLYSSLDNKYKIDDLHFSKETKIDDLIYEFETE